MREKMIKYLVVIDTFHSPDMPLCMECLLNLTEEFQPYYDWQKAKLLDPSAEEPASLASSNLSGIKMLVRMNRQRHIKSYVVLISEHLADELVTSIRNNEQEYLKLVMEKGEEVKL